MDEGKSTNGERMKRRFMGLLFSDASYEELGGLCVEGVSSGKVTELFCERPEAAVVVTANVSGARGRRCLCITLRCKE